MNKALIIIDLQKDFIDGSLGTPEAVAMLPAAVARIRAFQGDTILVTLDTHGENYLQTLEGQRLPVPHCIVGTPGHALNNAVRDALAGRAYRLVEKNTFGSFDLPAILRERYPDGDFALELLGLCTDICVISNALILRAAFPDVPIRVYADSCAGVSPQTHQAALQVLGCCQIDVL